MSADSLKLTIYFGERARTDAGTAVRPRFVADHLTDIYARHELASSLLLRGTMGFGAHQHLRTDRQLSLSEDLPVVSIAVDTRERIELALAEVERLSFTTGLVTLERARLVSPTQPIDQLETSAPGETKLTVYVGRHERIGGRPAYQEVVEGLHDHGLAGASVLLGVDGTAHGVRRRARFVGRNAGVPLMIIAVGDNDRIDAALPGLRSRLPAPVITLERVRVCKRDGHSFAAPGPPPEPPLWQKLMVHTGERAQAGDRPLHAELIRRLRHAGAAGATSLRGIWGYHGDHVPHGDSFWQLRRRVPIVTVIVDAPDRIARWYSIVDELTEEVGLVTCEAVRVHRSRPSSPLRSATTPGASPRS